jgi:hypothetical protein
MGSTRPEERVAVRITSPIYDDEITVGLGRTTGWYLRITRTRGDRRATVTLPLRHAAKLRMAIQQCEDWATLDDANAAATAENKRGVR